MMSSHFMMVLFVIIGYATTLAVIVFAMMESNRMDKEKTSLLNDRFHKNGERQ